MGCRARVKVIGGKAVCHLDPELATSELLGQCISTGVTPPPHRGYLAMSGDLLVVIPGRRKRMVAPGIWWVELRDAGVTILQITGWPDKKKKSGPRCQ